MKIVIIEDELVVADDLERNIIELIAEPIQITKLMSVAEGITYFQEKQNPDLIFSDIQLGDGLSFEIFVACEISVPVIFCTAYDEYALDAFKANGIDYILKPFSRAILNTALQKYTLLKERFSSAQMPQMEALLQLMSGASLLRPSSVLVYHQDKIIPINIDDIAIFYLSNEVVRLITFSGKVSYPNKNLDELERLVGNAFFRANRQCLVCRKAIVDVSSFFTRKLSLNLKVPFTEKVFVSKVKAPAFLKWLVNG